MKIKIEIGNETLEEFERIVDQIIRDVIDLRGMPLEKGGYMRTSIEHIQRGDLDAAITVCVREVKCSRLDDF